MERAVERWAAERAVWLRDDAAIELSQRDFVPQAIGEYRKAEDAAEDFTPFAVARESRGASARPRQRLTKADLDPVTQIGGPSDRPEGDLTIKDKPAHVGRKSAKTGRDDRSD